MSPSATAGARNGAPSMRAITVSARSIGRVGVRRLRRQLHALDALGDDRLDDCRDHRDGASPGRRRRRSRPRCRASPRRARRWPGCRQAPAPSGRPPRPCGRRVVCRPQAGHDRAGGGQAHPFEGDVAEPQHAGADTGPAWPPPTATSQPSASFIGMASASASPAGQGHAGVQLPTHGWPADGLQPAGELVVGLGSGAATGGPHHDLAGGPRCLQLDLVGLESFRLDRRCRFGRRRAQPGACRSRLSRVSVKSATTCSRSSPGCCAPRRDRPRPR